MPIVDLLKIQRVVAADLDCDERTVEALVFDDDERTVEALVFAESQPRAAGGTVRLGGSVPVNGPGWRVVHPFVSSTALARCPRGHTRHAQMAS